MLFKKECRIKKFLALIASARGIKIAKLKTFENAKNLVKNSSAYYAQIWEYDDGKKCYKFRAEFNDNLS